MLLIGKPWRKLVFSGFDSHHGYMENDYFLKNILDKSNNELHIPAEIVKNKGQFRKGNKPWNKGRSWDDMGISKEKQQAMRRNLETYQGKGNPKLAGWNCKPVIALDMYGDQKHWFKSSVDAAKKLGLIARNIRRACVKGYYCGDYRWKFDERFY